MKRRAELGSLSLLGLSAVLAAGCSGSQPAEQQAENPFADQAPKVVERRASPDIVPQKERPKAEVATVPVVTERPAEISPPKAPNPLPMVVERPGSDAEIKPRSDSPNGSAIAMQGPLEPIEVPPADPEVKNEQRRRENQSGRARSGRGGAAPTVAVPAVTSPYFDGFASAASAMTAFSSSTSSFGGSGSGEGGADGEDIIASGDGMFSPDMGMGGGAFAPPGFPGGDMIMSSTDDLSTFFDTGSMDTGPSPTDPTSDIMPTAIPEVVDTEDRPDDFLPNF